MDDYYLWQAHQHLETYDEAKYAKKLKSFRIPFRNEIRQDEGKLEAYSHEKYDQKQRIVPLPKMGAGVSKRYDTISSEYFTKKSIKQANADKAIADLSQQARRELRERREAYERAQLKRDNNQ